MGCTILCRCQFLTESEKYNYHFKYDFKGDDFLNFISSPNSALVLLILQIQRSLISVILSASYTIEHLIDAIKMCYALRDLITLHNLKNVIPLRNLKNVKNTHGGGLLLLKLQAMVPNRAKHLMYMFAGTKVGLKNTLSHQIPTNQDERN